jgi:hypothetical protein
MAGVHLGTQTKRWLGLGLAALIFAYLWSAGGYWHYVVLILLAVSAVVILTDLIANRKEH